MMCTTTTRTLGVSLNGELLLTVRASVIRGRPRLYFDAPQNVVIERMQDDRAKAPIGARRPHCVRDD